MTATESTPIAIASDFEETVADVVSQAPAALEFAERSRARKINSVYLVGCGGSHFAALPGYDLLLRQSRSLNVQHLTSAQFAQRTPKACGSSSIVIAASHSGRTPETVQAAEVARGTGATVVSISRRGDSPLKAAADVHFDYASDVTVNESKTIHFAQLALALLSAAEGDQPAREALESFSALPKALLRLKHETADVAPKVAEVVDGAEIVYCLAAGGATGAATALAGCYLQEMQWVHAAAVDAGDFFHGPFEVVTDNTAVIALISEDETRGIGERAGAFAERYSSRVAVIDSRDFELPGVPEAQRPAISPIALASATRRLLDYVAAKRDHETSQRRYMYKVEY